MGVGVEGVAGLGRVVVDDFLEVSTVRFFDDGRGGVTGGNAEIKGISVEAGGGGGSAIIYIVLFSSVCVASMSNAHVYFVVAVQMTEDLLFCSKAIPNRLDNRRWKLVLLEVEHYKVYMTF